MPSQTSPVGIRELARALNVSIGTVSRSLNNRYGVNAETRARVLEAAQRMGYVPNRAARQLKDRPAFQVGVLFNPFYGKHHEVNPYATQLIDVLRQSAGPEGLAVQVIDYSDDELLDEQFDQGSTDVAIMLGHFPRSTYEKVHALGKPSINMEYDSGLPGQVAVLSNGRAASEQAVQYLAALGHDKIALVTGPGQAMRFAAYFEGFYRGMREFHLPLNPDWVVELEPSQANAEGAEAATRQLLAQPSRPTAIIYASDWMAIGGAAAVKAANQRVGADVSIIGYDNLPQAAELDPPLTTFDMQWPRVARNLIRMTTDLASGRDTQIDSPVYLFIELIKRSSCACIRSLTDAGSQRGQDAGPRL